MRELTENEVEQVSGGNFFIGVLSITGAYTSGKFIGDAAYNAYTAHNGGTSLGASIYYWTH